MTQNAAARLTPNMKQILVRALSTGRVSGLGVTWKTLRALRDRGLVDPVYTRLTPEGQRVAEGLTDAAN